MKQAKTASFLRFRQSPSISAHAAEKTSLLRILSRMIRGEREEISRVMKEPNPRENLEQMRRFFRVAEARKEFEQARIWIEKIRKAEAEMSQPGAIIPRFASEKHAEILQAITMQKIRRSLPSIRTTGVKTVGKAHSHAANETRFFPDRAHSFAPSSARKR